MNGIRLTPGQQVRLERQLKETDDVRVYRRTLAILEHAQGRPIVRIARNMGVDRRSVHRWIESYFQNLDPAVLQERPRPGRPRLWTRDFERQMSRALEMSPEEYGYLAVNWTVPLLQEHLAKWTGQSFSEDTIRRGLGALGYVWKRPRYVLAPDPDREKKKTNPEENQGIASPQRHLG